MPPYLSCRFSRRVLTKISEEVEDLKLLILKEDNDRSLLKGFAGLRVRTHWPGTAMQVRA